jgi:hypothetical protein
MRLQALTVCLAFLLASQAQALLMMLASGSFGAELAERNRLNYGSLRSTHEPQGVSACARACLCQGCTIRPYFSV